MSFSLNHCNSLKIYPVLLVLICNGLIDVVSATQKYSVETRYIEVPLDHFTATATLRTFKLRYLINAKYYVKGGPIFIYTGGEREIEVVAQNTGFLFDIAPTFNALIIFVEHRYYGESLPFGNGSFNTPENLKYLTTTQALADFAYFIEHLRRTFFENVPNYKTDPFITFGGHYAGMLAVWLRMKYPYLVYAALTTTAPIFAFPGLVSCEGYYQKVTEVFEKYGREQCVKTVKLGWEIIMNLSKTKLGMDFISSKWKLCRKIKTAEDIETLLEWLSTVYVRLAVVNYHYPSEYYTSVPAYPVKIFCDKLTTSSFNDTRSFIESFSYALEIYTNYTGRTVCNNIYEAQDDSNEVAWHYQTCTEVIMPKCSTDYDMFITKAWDYELYALKCYKKFGVRSIRPDWAVMAYGGYNLNYVSNVLFSNSEMDPYSWGGFNLNNTENVLKYKIIESPDLMDLRGADTADNNYILQARQYYIKVLKKWLNIV